MSALPEPLNLMVLIAACLGRRVSETLALKWEDTDATTGTIADQRKITHGALGVPNTTVSGASLPLDATLRKIPGAWKPKTKDNQSVSSLCLRISHGRLLRVIPIIAHSRLSK